MTEWDGTFDKDTVEATEKHQTAETDADKLKFRLPECVSYTVSFELAQKIRDQLRRNPESSSKKDSPPPPATVPPSGKSALAVPIITSVTYMDVGCWAGSSEDDKNAKDHWKKQRYFGIVYERLSLLCAYEPWRPSGKPLEPNLEKARILPPGLDLRDIDQYKKILSLLQSLSTDSSLGPVVVLQAILNNQPGVALPPDDRIHVILGDLHAPVMTDRPRTYADRATVQPPHSSAGHGTAPSTGTNTKTGSEGAPWASIGSARTPTADTSWATGIGTGLASQPGASAGLAKPPTADTSWAYGTGTGLNGSNPQKITTLSPAGDDRHISIETGIYAGRYPLKGRYNRGVVGPALIPLLSRIFGKGARVIAKGETALVRLGAGGVLAHSMSPAVLLPGTILFGATGVALGDIATATLLRGWSDDDAVELSVVEDWFDRYHGREKIAAGADIFEDAGKDLSSWLAMIQTYQHTAGPRAAKADRPPVKLMQLGDLFDFWIGLKCPFDLVGGARSFPDIPSAKQFVQYWINESLCNKGISDLWNFDKANPRAADDELKTVFLYGNHDTYMGSELVAVAKRLPAQFIDKGKGLIAEHGHKYDSFNNEPTAGLGYLLTQAVFLDNYVRSLEDTMASAETKLFGGLWTRLGYNEAALKACVADGLKPGGVVASTFVMGHTHEPTLQRIDIVQELEMPSQRRSTSTGLPEAPKGPAQTQDSALDHRTSTLEPPKVAVSAPNDHGGKETSTKTSADGVPIPRALRYGPR